MVDKHNAAVTGHELPADLELEDGMKGDTLADLFAAAAAEDARPSPSLGSRKRKREAEPDHPTVPEPDFGGF